MKKIKLRTKANSVLQIMTLCPWARSCADSTELSLKGDGTGNIDLLTNITHTSSASLLWFIYSYISPPSVGLTESIWGRHWLLLKELSLPVLFHQELSAKTNAGCIGSPWEEGQLTVAIHSRPFSIWGILRRCFTLLKHADFIKTTQGFTSSAWFLCF